MRTNKMLEDELTNFALFADADPISFEEASKEEKWRLAMDQEIDSIHKNHTCELVDIPNGKKAIDVKWVYKTKLNENGEIDKFKACLVMNGYKQNMELIFEKCLLRLLVLRQFE